MTFTFWMGIIALLWWAILRAIRPDNGHSKGYKAQDHSEFWDGPFERGES